MYSATVSKIYWILKKIKKTKFLLLICMPDFPQKNLMKKSYSFVIS